MMPVYVQIAPGEAEYIGEAENMDKAIDLAIAKGFETRNFGCQHMKHPEKKDFLLVYSSWDHQGRQS